MTVQLTKAQIDAIKVELAKVGLSVAVARKAKATDWIAERELVVRAAALKGQSAFWRTTQLRNLKTRRQISPEYEAFITRNN
jgi:hypothetical protein